jgi:microcystin-dependent protein
MSDPFIGEIRIFPYNFAPDKWAYCNGQLLPIQQNTPLFSVIGTTYGGNGTTNFALPNLQANCAVGMGQAPGMQSYVVGQTGGANTVGLTAAQGVAHTHIVKAVNPFVGDGTSNTPGPTLAMAKGVGLQSYTLDTTKPVAMSPAALGPSTPPAGTANPQPHENRMPYLALSYCIALQGILAPHP